MHVTDLKNQSMTLFTLLKIKESKWLSVKLLQIYCQVFRRGLILAQKIISTNKQTNKQLQGHFSLCQDKMLNFQIVARRHGLVVPRLVLKKPLRMTNQARSIV